MGNPLVPVRTGRVMHGTPTRDQIVQQTGLPVVCCDKSGASPNAAGVIMASNSRNRFSKNSIASSRALIAASHSARVMLDARSSASKTGSLRCFL